MRNGDYQFYYMFQLRQNCECFVSSAGALCFGIKFSFVLHFLFQRISGVC